MSFAVPDLSEMIAKYQAFLAPEDPRFGEGISDWTITSEYDDNPVDEGDGNPIWGCMCSPSVLTGEGRRAKLRPADVEAKRAHIVARTPKSREDLVELERTVLHELGHVLHAKLNLPRDLEEEIMHSLDHFFSKLSPEQGRILARSLQNPMARAYRAETTAMPDDMNEDKDKPDEAPTAKDDEEKPVMQEGSVTLDGKAAAEIVASGDANAALEFIKKLLGEAAGALVGGNGSPPEAEPMPEPPTMGMKPEEAYARGKKAAEVAAMAKANREAVKAFAESLDDDRVTPEQRAEIAESPSMTRAQRLLKTYPRATQNATLGALPGKTPGKTENETPFARMRKGPTDPMVREALGMSNARPGAHGIGEAPAHILTLSFHEQAQESQMKNRADMKKRREAVQ